MMKRKMGFSGPYIIFLISSITHRSTHDLYSKNNKKDHIYYLKIFVFATIKSDITCILNRRVFVMLSHETLGFVLMSDVAVHSLFWTICPNTKITNSTLGQMHPNNRTETCFY